MCKLSDTQLVLLAAAAARTDGSLLPPPPSLAAQATGLTRSVSALIKRALVSEAPVTDPTLTWRSNSEQPLGAFITDAGRAAIGVEPGKPPRAEADIEQDQAAAAAPAARAGSKSALVLDLLTRADGATLGELVAATGWLPHTTRAALTGLRKKGHIIERGKRGEQSCYRVGAAA